MRYNPISPLVALAGSELEWYTLLTSALTPEQTAEIQKLFVTADQRKAAAGTCTYTCSICSLFKEYAIRVCHSHRLYCLNYDNMQSQWSVVKNTIKGTVNGQKCVQKYG